MQSKEEISWLIPALNSPWAVIFINYTALYSYGMSITVSFVSNFTSKEFNRNIWDKDLWVISKVLIKVRVQSFNK